MQEEQTQGRASTGKSHTEEAKHADGGTDLEAVEEPGDVPEPAREIPDSEEDDDEEEVQSEEGKGDEYGEDDTKLRERRVTRSANKQKAKKRR